MFEALKNTIDNEITTVILEDSIEPSTVGDILKQMLDETAVLVEPINNQNYFSGSGIPSSGVGENLDLYYRLQNPVDIYRKEAGAWVLKVSIPLGFTFADGPLIGLRTTFFVNYIAVTYGQWSIDGILYSKSTRTEFTITPADPLLERTDIIYASNSDDSISYLAGTPGFDPVLPANSVLIDTLYVPPVVSGQSPYLLLGNVLGEVAIDKTVLSFTEADLETDGDLFYLPVDTSKTIIEAKYKKTGETKTYRIAATSIEEDTAWTPNKRIYFDNNSAQTITITTI